MQVASFQNRRAGFLWGFAALWIGMLLAMTGVVLRDGPPEGYSVHAILAVGAFFWLGGLGLLAFIAGQSCNRISLQADGHAELVWRYPFHVKRRLVALDCLEPAEVIATRDSEGDPYFLLRVQTLDGDRMDIFESSDRAACERTLEGFNAALPRGG